MSKPKHSPLPWIGPGLWDSSGLTKNSIIQKPLPGGEWRPDIPTICTFPPGLQNRANAEFIVRACNNHYKLVDMLRRLEWSAGPAAGRMCCPVCRSQDIDGHSDGCDLAALLKDVE